MTDETVPGSLPDKVAEDRDPTTRADRLKAIGKGADPADDPYRSDRRVERFEKEGWGKPAPIQRP